MSEPKSNMVLYCSTYKTYFINIPKFGPIKVEKVDKVQKKSKISGGIYTMDNTTALKNKKNKLQSNKINSFTM